MKVGELFIALGFDVDDKKLKEFKDNIKDGTVALASMATTAAATVYAIKRFTQDSVDSSVKLKNFTEQTGVATEEVQRFYNVAGRKNPLVTLDDTLNAFTNLRDSIAQARLGTGPTGEAAMLGLNNFGNMTPMQAVMQLRKNFRDNVNNIGTGDERVVQQWMKAIGLGPEFLGAIKATDEEFNKLWNNPILGPEYLDRLTQLAQAQKEFGFQWDILKGKLSSAITPTATEFLKNLNTVMEKTYELGGKAIERFDKMPESLKLLTVGLSAAALAAAALLLPFGEIVAGAALILAAINDIGNYVNGKPSVTGGVIDGSKGLYDRAKKLITDELNKTPEQNKKEREEMLNGPAFGKVGQALGLTSMNQNNTYHIHSNGDPREVAQQVADTTAQREWRQNQANLLFEASGMHA